MKLLLLALALYTVVPLVAQKNPEHVFQGDSDIGHLSLKGASQYNNETQQYTLSGSGQNIWGMHDDFHFTWKKLRGDFILDAQLRFLGKGSNEHRKIGWMVRHSLEPNTVYADAAIHGDGLTSLQYRRAVDTMTEEIKTTITAPDVVRFERKGNRYTLSAAKFGQPLQTLASLELKMGDEVYAGLFISSHEENISEQAVFSNVRITVPAKDSFVPYQDFAGSRMEMLDVETGLRRVILESPQTFEAPNWLKDGSALIYNSGGNLYRLALPGNKAPEIINTSFIKHCNNDHILSPDNKWIGISSHESKTGSDHASLIYILPAIGGEPQLVTPTGPSYLHGWSPDGKTLAYCAERDHNFDVYTISIKGGKEKRLTMAAGLDDGPEYAPDGKHIYFNSARSGSMQIWRMKPDGSAQEQVTNDEYNNWFAHFSPDGKRMVFISFTKDIPADDHPPCKRVMIRMIATDGNAAPMVLAYVYGGQGTLNVPSWSPDGKQIAFVSYTFPDNYYDKK